ncbi:MAG: succinate dehydrogenase assembly factor 2 [Gammaproteobacteria bacterium]|nr:succinate dehydrogenase assembly factor 2 [Gammaproteobacteria bacterium]MBV9696241.1 succinate dehydrogenase assembly factor 2 [Gammaproteobacteria bacterium]
MDGAAEELRRTLWRCRRGMRELDVLLERFARGALPAAGVRERAHFEALLGLPDPVLAGYFLGGEVPGDAGLAALVLRIRTYVA